MPGYKQISITLPETLLSQIESRVDSCGPYDNRSQLIAECLDRYLRAIDSAKKNLLGMMSDAELNYIMDCNNGTIYTASTVTLIYANIEDSQEDGLSEKWEVDGKSLAAKIRDLDYIHCAALVDAIGKFWQSVSAGNQLEVRDALR